MTESWDSNGDGYVDAVATDLDGDGYLESASYDLDGDGVVDTTVVVDATTGASVVEMDTDGDGSGDSMFIDLDGDAYADVAYTMPGTELDPSTTTAPSATEPADDVPDSSPGLDSSDVSDPDLFITAEELPETGDEGVHGDPRGDLEYHTVQPGPVDCLPTSVSMVISEVTGEDVPAEDIVALANENGYMTDYGMSIEDSLSLLNSYGVEATVEYGDADMLRTALDAGDDVVIALDSADLYADGGGPFDPGMTSGHAVVLTGIDDGPPAYVYINDPAFTDGAGVQIPLEEFMDAWEDSECALLSIPLESAEDSTTDAAGTDTSPAGSGATEVDATRGAQEGTQTSATAAPEAAADHTNERLLLLPITLLVDAAREALGIVGRSGS